LYIALRGILQGCELGMSCLMVEFGEMKNLMDVLTQYEIWGFCRLGLDRLKFYRTNIFDKATLITDILHIKNQRIKT
ncbi:MAG: hypothetical protein QNL14_18310, partial [Deltaproteobacteria bacterium]|nr:hypothetical protein [Deltaproteobacteria bacterium]